MDTKIGTMEYGEASFVHPTKEEFFKLIAAAIYYRESDKVIDLLGRYEFAFGRMTRKDSAGLLKMHNAIAKADRDNI